MFYCYLHMWSSKEDMCPKCYTTETWTSTGIEIERPIEKKCEHKNLNYLTKNRGFIILICRDCNRDLKPTGFEVI